MSVLREMGRACGFVIGRISKTRKARSAPSAVEYPFHSHAVSAAVAVECVVQQVHFREFQRVLFASQRQPGIKPWTEYASEASIPDLERFERCVALPSDSFPRIAHGSLHHRAANGDTLLLIDASHRNLALTRAEQNMIEAEMAKTGLEPSTFQLGRQILQAIRLLHDGHVLVQIEEEPGQPGRLFDVFDPTGRLRGSIRLNHDLDPSVRWADRGDTIIAVTFGEMAVQYVVRLTIHRNKR